MNKNVVSKPTITDTVSYAIGVRVAKSYLNQGVKNINASFVSKAIDDVLAERNLMLTELQADLSLTRITNPSAVKNIADGTNFLLKNKAKVGVKLTESGLQYEVLVLGKGLKPVVGDVVVTHYIGTFIGGKEFDSSKNAEPISFELTKVIKGWTEGLQLMPVGSKYRLYIPYHLAYGINGRPGIPGGSTLIFDIELLEIKKKQSNNTQS